MAKGRFKSDATEAVHSAASGLYRANLIDKKTMREYDDLCIEAAPQFDPEAIARIRKSVNVSQSVFALYLNTTTSTIRQWEQGDKRPSGIAARMLQIVEKHGLEVFS
ncbi:MULTISPECIES: helix-turn-helix domain-containing protein [Burkholderia]|uniref:DNA-binding transcriptional regulator n=1 Tax=Burkholderia sola TaxID=2843302 RepID=A0ABV2CJH6_9BURK|nr:MULTISPECIES: DNA-binding transcriptional regulator [Burkholderia]KWU23726.1 DNA-binding protein [Burkholderia cenocepacia]MBP0611274.1 DNA-binding transcriptional regulator [Burkholderia sp. CpTa8-5]MBP0718229.1 DNA-binding transcriptional regulator [Burkholderia sp. AcTa6-5]OXI74717.1 transcriptional regulator [Burkholderia sp. AU31280]QRR14813.1 helix-turn-helix domain-containing protein [Burkholderia sp. MS389]